MSGAPLFQHFGWNAFTIIPNSQPKRPSFVADFSLDMAGMGMLEGIGQSLARDSVNLIPDDGVQVSCGSLHLQIEGRGIVARKLIAYCVQGFRKVVRHSCR